MEKLTDNEVLQKAIEIAIENGLQTKDVNYYTFNRFIGAVENGDYSMIDSFDCYNLIFSHYFAKAFWGDKQKDTGYEEISGISGGERVDTSAICIEAWKYHLQQMVLCENPIDYLRRFVDNT
jgi:hypothetical protein